ncbi:hypothetical protein ACFE04_004205 [Oxalis oulophora]
MATTVNKALRSTASKLLTSSKPLLPKSGPAAAFQNDHDLNISTYIESTLCVYDVNEKYSLHTEKINSTQTMTPAGLTTSTFGSSDSSLDGISKYYVSPEGVLNLTLVEQTLKYNCGLRSTNFIYGWNWADNHTTLLLNMLRYVLICRMTNNGAHAIAALHDFTSGGVTVSPASSAFKINDYPDGTGWGMEWPCTNFPRYTKLDTECPSSEHPAIILLGLSPEQCRFVLLMTAKWERRSRLRLDFAVDKLAEEVLYRADTIVPSLDDWATPGEEAGAVMPEPVSWEQGWYALKVYVSHNRLYDHFSTVLYLVSGLSYQFWPTVAEAFSWLQINWNVSLPEFRSIRGRFTFFNGFEAFFASHRALSEWDT